MGRVLRQSYAEPARRQIALGIRLPSAIWENARHHVCSRNDKAKLAERVSAGLQR